MQSQSDSQPPFVLTPTVLRMNSLIKIGFIDRSDRNITDLL